MSVASGRPRLLVFAYACEPGRGSEPGAGWGLVTALAGFADCTVLVAPEHMPAIRRWEAGAAAPLAEFVEVGERWLRPPTNRHRFTRFLLYLAWLRRAKRVAAALHRTRPFDAMWHATYSVYWLPAPAADFDVPCVWGPVGGAVVAPRSLWTALGWRGTLSELTDHLAVWLLDHLPATRRTWRTAAARLVQNDQTRARMPAPLQGGCVVLNHALLTEPAPGLRWARRSPDCLFVGALESRKGAALVLHALAKTPRDIRLRIVGDGPDRPRLTRLARALRIDDRVDFLGRATRDGVAAHLSECAVAVYAGLREEGGLALAEALLAGTPVVVLAHGGARTVAEAATDPDRVALIAPGTLDQVSQAMADAITRFVRQAPAGAGPLLRSDDAAAILEDTLAAALRRRSHPARQARPFPASALSSR